MSKKRKAYSPLKRQLKLSRAILKGTAVMYTTGVEVCSLVSTSNGDRLSVTPITRKAITEYRHKWKVFMAVFCRDQLGKEYIRSGIADPKGEYLHTELLDALNDEHQKLIKEANPKHIIGAGWLACPDGAEIEDDKACEIFTKSSDIWEYTNEHINP